MTHALERGALATREFTLRSKTEGRELTAIGVPYDTEVEIAAGYFERFAPGSVEDEGAILRYAHREPLGLITSRRDITEGREIQARVSDTTLGRDAAVLLADGVLTRVSIGFYPLEWEETKDEAGLHVTITRAKAVEYSIVEFPAYPTAAIKSVRNKKDTPAMPTTETRAAAVTVEQFERAQADTNAALDDLGRKVDLIATQTATREAAELPFQFRSIGEYAKALATGDEEARAAFAGAVVGDAIARPAWLGVLERRMAAKQPVTALFMHTMDLPSAGMTVEYGVRKEASTVKVGKQSKEGSDLPKGKPASYEVKSAAVDTFGGSSEISFQAVERATVSLLDDLLYDQALEYAKEIEKATREQFTAAVTTAEESPLVTIDSLAASVANDWTKAVLKVSDHYDETAYVLDGLLVSGEVFEHLATMPKAPTALAFAGTPEDHHGTLSIPQATGSFIQLMVTRIPNWTGKHAVAYSREAIRVKESPGAPFRLQDSDIFDLTKGFAVYGYAAHFTPKPELIQAIKFTA